MVLTWSGHVILIQCTPVCMCACVYACVTISVFTRMLSSMVAVYLGVLCSELLHPPLLPPLLPSHTLPSPQLMKERDDVIATLKAQLAASQQQVTELDDKLANYTVQACIKEVGGARDGRGGAFDGT